MRPSQRIGVGGIGPDDQPEQRVGADGLTLAERHVAQADLCVEIALAQASALTESLRAAAIESER